MADISIGAGMGQLDELRQRFDRSFSDVAGVQQRLGPTVEGSEPWWRGRAADDFRRRWQQEYAPMLKRLEGDLQERSGEIKKRHGMLQDADR
jgi:uncharacterized protein YukE